ncbi:MAG: SPFH domain-containing protein [Planctomycetota bacterium]
MPRALLIIIALIILGGFALFASSYTVRFTENAVVTKFGQADEESVVASPGLKWKLPSPLSSVTKYDKRARFLEPAPETFSTADQTQLVVQAFITWRVDDPLTFYKRHRGEAGSSTSEHYRVAENNLRSILRSALSEVSGFRREELFAAGSGNSKIKELEDAIKRRMTTPPDEGLEGVGSYGIAIDLVGITSIELPESVTEQVFTLMQAGREKITNETRSEGNATAQLIVSEAESSAERILEFAKLRAGVLINRGELEAEQYLAQQAVNPDLAVFLQQLKLMQDNIGRQTTLVLDTDTFVGLDIFDRNSVNSRFNLNQLRGAEAGDNR